MHNFITTRRCTASLKRTEVRKNFHTRNFFYLSVIKISAVFMIVGILTGCASTVNVEYIDKSYSTDTINANAQIPQIKGLSGNDLQEKINDEYLSICSEMLKDFSDAAKETNEQSVFDTQTTEHYNKNGFLSIVTQVDYFARKTHKNSFRITKNIDTKNCVELSLSDIFADDAYIDVLNERLSTETSEHPEQYSDLWAKPKISQNQRFYINEKNLVLFYPPYELSYYERGFVEIPIKLADLSGYLKPEYRFMAGQ